MHQKERTGERRKWDFRRSWHSGCYSKSNGGRKERVYVNENNGGMERRIEGKEELELWREELRKLQVLVLTRLQTFM